MLLLQGLHNSKIYIKVSYLGFCTLFYYNVRKHKHTVISVTKLVIRRNMNNGI